MVTFSVIIPAYNVRNYIIVAIQSLLAQVFQDYEIICVDDCSIDGTAEILKNYAEENEKIRVLSTEKHIGPGEARNIALKAAQGKYIACLDADDVADKNFLQAAYEKLEETGVSSVWVKAKIYWENDNKITPMFTFPILQNQPEGFLELTPDNITDYPAYSWYKFLRKDSIKENIYWSHNLLFEDVEFYYRYYTQNPLVYVIDKPLYLYRRRRNSIMGQSIVDVNYHKNLFYVTENIYNFLIENDLFEKYKKALLKLCVQNISEYEGFENIRPVLRETVNSCLANIHFPEKYNDLKMTLPYLD
ncbi:MAG: glycosyltransferase [Candidatus Gastranaerophilales bacterium]|nr:glycosyltransferase [Candidatus Gastranaerophilales bacterium]